MTFRLLSPTDGSHRLDIRSVDGLALDECGQLVLCGLMTRLSLRAAVAVAGVGIAVVAASTLARRAMVDLRHGLSYRQRLFTAFSDSRLVGVRLVGLEFPTQQSSRVTASVQREIAREIETSARENPTPQALDDLGLLRLVTGRYDAAIRLIERASRRAPSDATIRTDLDAAYLASGRALDRPRDLVRALDRIGPEPSVLESVYNRALALQSLYLHRLAKAAWAQYCRRDPNSSWSRLAKGCLHTLSASERALSHDPAGQRITNDNASNSFFQSSRPEDLQTWFEEKGLKEWTSAVLAGDQAGREIAEERLRQAATRLVELSGDRLPADESAFLAAAPAENLGSLAAGLRDYVEARSWLDQYSFERALALFERAAERLRRVSSPHRWWAETGIAHCELQLERYEAARRRATQILTVAHRQSYVAVEARCAWVLAGIGLGTLDLDSARRDAMTFHTINQRARNRTGTATASLLLARIEDELGDSAAAWFHRLRGFRDLAEDHNDERLALAIGNASFALAREGEFRAATNFASEALEFDRQQGTPLGLAESHWIRAMHRTKGGDVEGALADVRQAKFYLPWIDSAANRTRILAGLRAVEGSLLCESQPLVALSSLDAALGFLHPTGYEYGQAEILIDRARAFRKLGRFKEALADLNQAAHIVVVQRKRIQEPVLRVSFFNLQAELADERVAASLYFDPRGEHAFWAADQARGLLFRDSLGLAPSEPAALEMPAARFLNQIDKDDAVLSYWSLPDSLLIWIARRDQPPRLVRRAITRARLSQQISDFVAAIEEGADSKMVSSLARQLGETLIAPVATDLADVRRLILVPDRVVRAVPWPALENGFGEGPLLRRFVIRICPAAGMLGVHRSVQRSADEPTSIRLLAIGAPKVNSSVANYGLPGALREIEGIARLFADHVTLTGLEATRGRLLSELGRASILHIASHFSVGRDPGSSRMLLASSPRDMAGSLDAGAIARLSLPRLHLAVLSGCATDREAEPSLEGTFAAAGSFLAAGVAETIASLWPVDDRSTAELMTRFYRELLDGRSTDEALRSAQLALLDEADEDAHKPSHWAAFQLVSLGSRSWELNRGKERR